MGVRGKVIFSIGVVKRDFILKLFRVVYVILFEIFSYIYKEIILFFLWELESGLRNNF